jgi:small GTP-binding protein
MEPARVLKVVFLGDSGVGKTSIINDKCMGSFDPNTKSTLGSDHDSVDVRVEGETTRLHIWDTAGQEKYNSLVPFYLRGCDVACIVSSAVDENSIDNQRTHWLELIEAERRTPILIAVVNKIDLCEEENPPFEGLSHILNPFFSHIVFVSAKNYEGIDELFALIAKQEPGKGTVSTVIETRTTGCC